MIAPEPRTIPIIEDLDFDDEAIAHGLRRAGSAASLERAPSFPAAIGRLVRYWLESVILPER